MTHDTMDITHDTTFDKTRAVLRHPAEETPGRSSHRGVVAAPAVGALLRHVAGRLTERAEHLLHVPRAALRRVVRPAALSANQGTSAVRVGQSQRSHWRRDQSGRGRGQRGTITAQPLAARPITAPSWIGGTNHKPVLDMEDR